MLSRYLDQTVRDAPLSAAVRLSIIVAAFKALIGLNEKYKIAQSTITRQSPNKLGENEKQHVDIMQDKDR